MEEKKLNGKWLDSLDFKTWSIAYEIADPEDQIENIKHLIREEIVNAYDEGFNKGQFLTVSLNKDVISVPLAREASILLINEYIKEKGL